MHLDVMAGHIILKWLVFMVLYLVPAPQKTKMFPENQNGWKIYLLLK